ncbi:ATP-dependent rRNA helicase spb4 [Grosmannia clavigera kw1407]|uniref:RNA helicase n=1 Tax=Grosmannia clavigera (strain kw1407 / UAMH 11150) TaxID=655863 RepID=F0X7I9_GROCL|nr:ATP-dependent rRNA helicase spb4 [Grosmannia clavigera kw1407]EFX06282.1 ATP-dependent rRNA helicase spb4 [Grosmannia clavigera kw1407]
MSTCNQPQCLHKITAYRYREKEKDSDGKTEAGYKFDFCLTSSPMAPVSRNAAKRASSSARSWEAAGLPDWCRDAVASMGFSEPTPSQAAAIPLFLANSDVVVEAPTGSGKSLAFLLPLAARLLRPSDGEGKKPPGPIKRGHVAAVILVPTRELADQLHRVLLDLLAFHPATAAVLPHVWRGSSDASSKDKIKNKNRTNKNKTQKTPAANGLQIVGDLDEEQAGNLSNRRRPETTTAVLVPQLVVGGTASKPADDLARFVRQGSNVLVGTPGRLAELLSSRVVNATGSFEALVLDEADRLLDLGFAADLQRILAFVPKQRRTFLCSASVNDAIGELIKVNLRNPKRVVVRVQTRRREGLDTTDGTLSGTDEKKTPASLLNTFVAVPSSHKLPVLLRLLEHVDPRPLRTLVFMASCFSVKYYAAVLAPAVPPGYSVVSLHGKLEPHVREKAFARFLAATSPCVLLTTDVAARGLDVPQADLVVNIDPPTDPKTFLHRCGRTGRAGRRGLAVTMLRPGREADDYVTFLRVRKTPVEPLADAVPSLAAAVGLGPASDPDVAEAAALALTRSIRRQVRDDRELHQLGQRAFVSWARAFQEHRASSIFRAADLDWNDLGHAWGLARLPKMPELRAAGITDRSLGLGQPGCHPDDAAIDVDAIPFRDPAKEKRRRAELAAAVAAKAKAAAAGPQDNQTPAEWTTAAEARKRNAPWSARQDRDTLRGDRRDRKRRKREAERYALMTPAERAEAAKTDLLVAQVRRQTLAAAAAEAAAEAKEAADEFAGFAD